MSRPPYSACRPGASVHHHLTRRPGSILRRLHAPGRPRTNRSLAAAYGPSANRSTSASCFNLTEHMETVIQKYLRNEYETIDEYNAQAGELAEPYRYLVIADYPSVSKAFLPPLASMPPSWRALRRLHADDPRHAHPRCPGLALRRSRSSQRYLIRIDGNTSGKTRSSSSSRSSSTRPQRRHADGHEWTS